MHSIHTYTHIHITGVGSEGVQGWHVPPPPFFWLGGNGMLTPHFHFPLVLYVYITLTNNYLAFFIYQFIILWTISINWHRWLLVNNQISKYNSFILILYRRYINYVFVCHSPPPPPTHTFWHLPTPLHIYTHTHTIHTHTHTRTYAYTYTHTHTPIRTPPPPTSKYFLQSTYNFK